MMTPRTDIEASLPKSSDTGEVLRADSGADPDDLQRAERPLRDEPQRFRPVASATERADEDPDERFGHAAFADFQFQIADVPPGLLQADREGENLRVRELLPNPLALGVQRRAVRFEPLVDVRLAEPADGAPGVAHFERAEIDASAARPDTFRPLAARPYYFCPAGRTTRPA